MFLVGITAFCTYIKAIKYFQLNPHIAELASTMKLSGRGKYFNASENNENGNTYLITLKSRHSCQRGNLLLSGPGIYIIAKMSKLPSKLTENI